jgi:hypothetical protein
MIRKMFFSCLFLLQYSFVFAQASNYDLSINYKPSVKLYWQEYNSSFINTITPQSLDKRIKSLSKMMQIMEPFNTHIIDLAWAYHEKRDYANAVKCYYLAVSKGYIPCNKYTQPYFMQGNDAIPEYKAVLLKLDSIAKHPNAKMDIAFCNLVIELHAFDLMSRSLDFLEKDSSAVRDKAAFRKQFVTYSDDRNLKKLLTHIKENGIPHANWMTDDAYTSFLIVVHHLVQNSSDPEARELFNLVKDAIADGRLPNKFLKAAIDYMYWPVNGQYFGTVSLRNKEGKYQLSPPLIDPETVDQRRAIWLLEPLEQQMRNSYEDDFVLPEAYPAMQKIK